MDDTQRNNQAMSGNVQGFELPTGCLMTSVFILLPIVAVIVAVIL
jgi:hypothetical protein